MCLGKPILWFHKSETMIVKYFCVQKEKQNNRNPITVYESVQSSDKKYNCKVLQAFRNEHKNWGWNYAYWSLRAPENRDLGTLNTNKEWAGCAKISSECCN